MGSEGEVGGVELLSKRVGRERGKTTHTHTHTHARDGGEGGGGGGRREREGAKSIVYFCYRLCSNTVYNNTYFFSTYVHDRWSWLWEMCHCSLVIWNFASVSIAEDLCPPRFCILSSVTTGILNASQS